MTLVVAGQTAAAGAISVKVAALTEGVLKTMLLTKLKLVTAVLLVVALLGTVVGALVVPALGQAPADPTAPKPPAAAKSEEAKNPHPAGPGTLLLVRADSIDVLTPEGKKVAEFSAPDETKLAGIGRLSPDGARVAFVLNKELVPRQPGNPTPWPYQVVIRKIDADKPLIMIDMPCEELCLCCWSPDGKQLVAAKMTGPGDNASFENQRHQYRCIRTGCADGNGCNDPARKVSDQLTKAEVSKIGKAATALVEVKQPNRSGSAFCVRF